MGIFNKEIIYVLDYEGHLEKIRLTPPPPMSYIPLLCCLLLLLFILFISSHFPAQVCDTRGSDGGGDEEWMKLAQWFILALAD